MVILNQKEGGGMMECWDAAPFHPLSEPHATVSLVGKANISEQCSETLSLHLHLTVRAYCGLQDF